MTDKRAPYAVSGFSESTDEYVYSLLTPEAGNLELVLAQRAVDHVDPDTLEPVTEIFIVLASVSAHGLVWWYVAHSKQPGIVTPEAGSLAYLPESAGKIPRMTRVPYASYGMLREWPQRTNLDETYRAVGVE